jgi:hypothetical protein
MICLSTLAKKVAIGVAAALLLAPVPALAFSITNWAISQINGSGPPPAGSAWTIASSTTSSVSLTPVSDDANNYTPQAITVTVTGTVTPSATPETITLDSANTNFNGFRVKHGLFTSSMILVNGNQTIASTTQLVTGPNPTTITPNQFTVTPQTLTGADTLRITFQITPNSASGNSHGDWDPGTGPIVIAFKNP